MLIDDRSVHRSIRPRFIGSAIDFRGAFRSRAGGFAARDVVSLFATAIALTIASAATATAARMGMWRFFASRASRSAC